MPISRALLFMTPGGDEGHESELDFALMEKLTPIIQHFGKGILPTPGNAGHVAFKMTKGT